MKTTPPKKMTRFGVAAAAMAAMMGSQSGSAATASWLPEDTGAFTIESNWSTGTVPGTGDTAEISNGGTAQITEDDVLSIDLLTVSDGGLDFSGGSLTTLLNSDVRIGSAGGTAALTMNGGALEVAGSLRFGDAGSATISVTDATVAQSANSYLIFGGGGSGSVTATFSGSSSLVHKGGWFIFGDNTGSSANATFEGTTEVSTDDWTFFGKGGQADVTFKDGATFTNTAGATIVGEANLASAPATLTLQDNVTLTHQGSSHFVVGHNGGTGTMSMSGTSQAVVAGEVYIGNDANGETLSNGTLNLSGSSVFSTTGTKFVIARYNGTGNVSVSQSATLDVDNIIVVAENGAAALTISDAATVQTASGQNIYIGSGPNSSSGRIVADGTVTLNGGSLIATNASVVLGTNNSNNAGTNNIGTLNLNGGTITANSITKGSGTGTVNFNGSTVKSSITNSDYLSGFEDADLHVQEGGIKFDTNTFDVAINQSLDGAGGLQKLGEGGLYLFGANTFSGDTLVSGGTLIIEGSLEGSGFLGVASGAAVQLDTDVTLNDSIVLSLVTGSELALMFDGTETIGALSIDGEFLEIGEYTLAQLQTEGGDIFSGNSSAVLNVTAVPEPGVVAMLGLGAAIAGLCRRRRGA